MTTTATATRSALKFVVLVVAISTVFWVLAAVTDDLTAWLPVNLPISALMFVCPLIAAVILVGREDGRDGVRRLLRRAVDHNRITNRIWYVPMILLMPVMMLVSYVIMRVVGVPLPEPHIPLAAIPAFFVLYLISAISEELGWSAYVTDALQRRWSPLTTGVVIGVVWGIWHAIPYLQAGNTVAWTAWQVVHSVAFRVILVWLYNGTGHSVLAVSVGHAMGNVSWSLFPNFGSHYDPAFVALVETVVAVIVTRAWPWMTRRARRPLPQRAPVGGRA